MDLQQALQLGNGLSGMNNLGGNALGAVDTAAAADGHDGLAAMLFVGFVAELHIIGGGVGGIIGLNGIADAVCVKAVQHGLDLTAAHHAGAGDNQHIIDALFLHEGTQFLDLTGSFQIFGHPVTHKVVADLQYTLKGTAP